MSTENANSSVDLVLSYNHMVMLHCCSISDYLSCSCHVSELWIANIRHMSSHILPRFIEGCSQILCVPFSQQMFTLRIIVNYVLIFFSKQKGRSDRTSKRINLFFVSGNDVIHELTVNKNRTLYIKVKLGSVWKYAMYYYVRVASESKKYQITLSHGSYSGNAGT